MIGWLEQNGYAPRDLGAHGVERRDALDHATALAATFSATSPLFGVLTCGSGQAMAMTANRYGLPRAALGDNVAMARTAREHNDANMLVLGAGFLGGRYAERRDALTA